MNKKVNLFFNVCLALFCVTACSNKVVVGPQGPQGEQGEQGIPGEQGPQGEQGIPGEDGQDGQDGKDGVDGKDGQDGTSILTGNGQPSSTLGKDGDSYIDLDTWNYYIKDNDSWVLKGNIKGSDGAPGQDGKDGADGKDGQDGSQGAQGDKGDTGVSITDTYIDENGDLIVTFSDGSIKNAGHVKDNNKYTVKFHVDDEIIATKEVLKGDTVSRPTPSETAGYTINDWHYLDGTTHESWKFFGYVITEDTDLYAEFSYNQYTISFIDDLHGHVIDDLTVTYDKEYELPVISQTGYSFSGWKDNNDSIWNGSGTYRIPSNITLHAVWNANNYTVTLNPEGGELDTTSINVIFDSQYELPEPVKAGYTFLGWYDGENRISSKATWSHTEDKTYSAKWSNIPMTFIFDAGDGTCAIDSSVILYDSQYELPEPTRNGYAFMGWTLNGDVIPQSGTWKYTTSGATLYALWDINDKGIVPIISNDGQYVSYGLYPQTNVNDADLIVELNGLDDSYIKDNGWYFYNNSYYAKLTAKPYGGNCDPQFRNGVTIENGKTYWFKCEPIQWKILKSESGNSFIVSNEILDIGKYNYTSSNRTIGGKTIYASNYKESSIRQWLNASFYSAVFMLGSKLVQTTNVINDETTNDGRGTTYICENTEDKVFLLSYQDYKNADYGFTDSNSSRRSKVTDWAKAKGAYIFNSREYGYYWTRTAVSEKRLIHIQYDGGLYGIYDADNSWLGIRPAITIKLN